jgi:hypothetical protein
LWNHRAERIYNLVSLIFVTIDFRGLIENEMFVDILFHRFDTC